MNTSIPADVNIQKQLTAEHMSEWVRGDLFQLKWWILIAIILALWVTWWLLLDKSRVIEIGLYTGLSIILFMGVNEYGEELVLWDYPVDVIPIFPPLSSLNLMILPLFFSQLYQRFKELRKFIWAAAAGSCFAAFVIDPVLSLSGYMVLVRWQYYESLPVYFLAALVVRGIVVTIYDIVRRQKGMNQERL